MTFCFVIFIYVDDIFYYQANIIDLKELISICINFNILLKIDSFKLKTWEFKVLMTAKLIEETIIWDPKCKIIITTEYYHLTVVFCRVLRNFNPLWIDTSKKKLIIEVLNKFKTGDQYNLLITPKSLYLDLKGIDETVSQYLIVLPEDIKAGTEFVKMFRQNNNPKTSKVIFTFGNNPNERSNLESKVNVISEISTIYQNQEFGTDSFLDIKIMAKY